MLFRIFKWVTLVLAVLVAVLLGVSIGMYSDSFTDGLLMTMKALVVLLVARLVLVGIVKFVRWMAKVFAGWVEAFFGGIVEGRRMRRIVRANKQAEQLKS